MTDNRVTRFIDKKQYTRHVFQFQSKFATRDSGITYTQKSARRKLLVYFISFTIMVL